jgi:hypothetical protein
MFFIPVGLIYPVEMLSFDHAVQVRTNNACFCRLSIGAASTKR